MLDQSVAVPHSQRKVKSISLNVVRCYCKKDIDGTFYRLIGEKNDTIECSKQGEQSSFVLLWAVSKSSYFGVLQHFCCRIFCFQRLKCHRYMLELVTQPKHISGCEVGFNTETQGLLT